MIERPTTGFLVWRLALKWRAAVDRAVRPLGLTHAQYSLLGSLTSLTRSGIEPSQRELADFSGLEPVYVSKLARSLERAGLVERLDHPSDPRAFSLRLTPHGEEVIGQAMAVVRELHQQLTAPIGGPDSARGRQLITTLRALLGEGETP
jgi:DNA-binding MarR family transcriptional regulator